MVTPSVLIGRLNLGAPPALSPDDRNEKETDPMALPEFDFELR